VKLNKNIKIMKKIISFGILTLAIGAIISNTGSKKEKGVGSKKIPSQKLFDERDTYA
jgi:multisubunit Na+/H+ antiporter MnhC subunit